MSLTLGAIFLLKAAAAKAAPIIATKVVPVLAVKATAVLAGSGVLLTKLASAPALKAVAVKLATSEAFQAFAVKLATSKVGETIIVKGTKYVVTKEMKEELKDIMKNPKFADITSKAGGKVTSETIKKWLDSLD